MATLLLATSLSAQTVVASDAPSPVRQVLIDALGPKAAEVGKTPTFAALVAAMTPEVRADAKTKLDSLGRAPLTTSVLTDLSKVYTLLGSHSSAAQAGLTLQEREPKATKGLILAANAKLAEGNYAESAMLANEALKINPKDRDALAAWNTAKDRVSPTGRSSTLNAAQSTAQNSVVVSQPAVVDNRPLKLGYKSLAQTTVPDFKNDEPVQPAPNGHPWLPYAIGFGLTVFGIGMAVKHSLEDAKGAVLQTVDKTRGGAENLLDKTEDWIYEHPTATKIVFGVGTAVAIAGLITFTGGLGGGPLVFVTAGGGTLSGGVVAASGVAAT